MIQFLVHVILAVTYVTIGCGFLLDTSSPPSIPRDGVHFETNRLIRLTYDGGEFPAKDMSYFRVGFHTRKKQGILLQIRDGSNQDYISLGMNNNGGIKFVADHDAGRFELDTKSYLPTDYALNYVDYADGLVHEVIVQRSADGRNVTMQMYTEGADANQSKVDNYASVSHSWAADGLMGMFRLNNPWEQRAAGPYFNITVDFVHCLTMANKKNNTTSSYRGFEGCITHMQIDSFYPLQKAFQIPTPSYVHMFPNAKLLQTNTCGCVIKVWDPFNYPVVTKPVHAAQKYSGKTNTTCTNWTFPTDKDWIKIEIPMKLRSDMMVKYAFNRTLEYFANSRNLLIRVSFVTDIRQGTLVKIADSVDSYIALEINNNGSVTFLFRDGTFAFDIESSNSANVADGRPHDASVYRSAGQATIALYVDGYHDYGMVDCKLQTWLEERKNYLYIGNSDALDDRTGFDGCIYDLRLGNFDYPHDEFAYVDLWSDSTKGTLYNLDAMFNETTSTEYIRSICGMDSLKNTTSILSDGLT